MFTFKGTSVFSFKSLGGVLSQLKDREEGEELLRACEGEFGKENAGYVLGYLLGYFNITDREKIMRHLPRGIEHPVWGTKFPQDPLGDEAVGAAITMSKLWANAVAENADFKPVAFKKQKTEARVEEKPEMAREEAEWNF